MALDRKIFLDGIRHGPFPGTLTQGQVDGMNALLDAIDKHGFIDPRWSAYMLATVYHETAHTMQPIEEYGHGRGRVYGKPTGPWGCVYDGRGDVQLTWEANYIHATKRLRELGAIDSTIDLDRNPDLAMRPDIAAAIMIYGMVEGWFTHKRLADYIHGQTTDFIGARRIINGTDRAQLIAGYAQQFLEDLTAAGA